MSGAGTSSPCPGRGRRLLTIAGLRSRLSGSRRTPGGPRREISGDRNHIRIVASARWLMSISSLLAALDGSGELVGYRDHRPLRRAQPARPLRRRPRSGGARARRRRVPPPCRPSGRPRGPGRAHSRHDDHPRLPQLWMSVTLLQRIAGRRLRHARPARGRRVLLARPELPLPLEPPPGFLPRRSCGATPGRSGSGRRARREPGSGPRRSAGQGGRRHRAGPAYRPPGRRRANAASYLLLRQCVFETAGVPHRGSRRPMLDQLCRPPRSHRRLTAGRARHERQAADQPVRGAGPRHRRCRASAMSPSAAAARLRLRLLLPAAGAPDLAHDHAGQSFIGRSAGGLFVWALSIPDAYRIARIRYEVWRQGSKLPLQENNIHPS